MERWESPSARSGRGKGVGGSGGSRVGQLITGILTRQNHGFGLHGVNPCEGVGHHVLQLCYELLKTAPARAFVFEALDWYLWGQGGVTVSLFHSFLVENHIAAKLWNPPPPAPNFLHPLSPSYLAITEAQNSRLTIYPRLSTKMRVMGDARRSGRREGWEVA